MGRPGWACEWFHHRYRDGGSLSHPRLHRIGRSKVLKDGLEVEGVSRCLLEQNKIGRCWLLFRKILKMMKKMHSFLKMIRYWKHVRV